MSEGLHLAVTLAGGTIHTALLRPGRRLSLSRVIPGRPAAEVPAAFERLYALCGRSHRIAAGLAIAAARGSLPAAAARQAAARELAAERAGEHLRTTFATAAALGLPLAGGELAALRAGFAATRPGAPADGLPEVLAALGLDLAAPPPASWAARMLDAAGPEADAALPVDALSAADDAAVLAALAATAGAHPVFPRRRPETGPLARSGVAAAGPRQRLAARFAEIRHAAALLLDRAANRPDDWLTSGTLPEGSGYAAVETPRGRMHHLAAVDRRDVVTRWAVLAPTDWNFSPDGPFVRALPGLRVGSGGAAAARLRWLIGLYDPCVACGLDLHEADLPAYADA